MNRIRWAAIATAFYVAVLLVSPFTHHDLDCELKHPQHCTACTASHVAADPDALSAPGASALVDLGSAQASLRGLVQLLLAVRTVGRSPPAAL